MTDENGTVRLVAGDPVGNAKRLWEVLRKIDYETTQGTLKALMKLARS